MGYLTFADTFADVRDVPSSTKSIGSKIRNRSILFPALKRLVNVASEILFNSSQPGSEVSSQKN
jgi:hypothetical protein